MVDTAEGKPISEQKTNFGPTTSLTANDGNVRLECRGKSLTFKRLDLIIPPRTSPRSILDGNM